LLNIDHQEENSQRDGAIHRKKRIKFICNAIDKFFLEEIYALAL
jgi:hypothetical protein